MRTNKTPLPGYGLAIIETSQFSNMDFAGEDRFDTPQTGKLILLRDEDKSKDLAKGMKFSDLLDKKIYWAKYADQDGTFTDDELGNVVFIKLEKIIGYDNE